MDNLRKLTTKASEVYQDLVFNKSDDLFNKPAPDPVVTFVMGAAFSIVAVYLWFQRFCKLSRAVDEKNWSSKLAMRAMISAAIDIDSPAYTIFKTTAQSFLFLAGIQLNYETAFIVMLAYFAFESSLDAFRTLLSVVEYQDFNDLVVTSNRLRNQIKKTNTQLTPSNVYEDLSRDSHIVVMVFVTQALLISFVVVDIFNGPLHSCPDGTRGCPVGGTLGSWCFYILGIFMASVFLLGPRTKFGQSEMNPAFWMQLLLVIKNHDTHVKWHDPTFDPMQHRQLARHDVRVWLRFVTSFLINGVGFHILVQALPLQIASQASLTGVVFRAVGMLYLVDLDDTPGYTLTFTDGGAIKTKEIKTFDEDEEDHHDAEEDSNPDAYPYWVHHEQVERIIQEARDKLEALATCAGQEGLVQLSGGIAIAANGGVGGACALQSKPNKETVTGGMAGQLVA